MKLYETVLKKIIKFIEKYGHITKIEVENSEVCLPIGNFEEGKSTVQTFDFFQPNKFIIYVTIGDVKTNE